MFKVLDHLDVTPIAAVEPQKPRPRSFHTQFFVLMLKPDEVWSAAVIESECGNFYTLFPKCFHSALITLTADRGISRQEEISQTDLLQWWHPLQDH